MTDFDPTPAFRLSCACFGALSTGGTKESCVESGGDPGVRFQDDLFRAANSHWLDTIAIPPDKSRYGSFVQLSDLADKRIRTIVDELSVGQHAADSVEKQVGSFYAAYMDTARIDAAGLAPIAPWLATIDAIQTPRQLAQWQGQAQGLLDTPVRLWVSPDFKEPGVNRALIWQGGLGLPDRDYFLKTDDPPMAQARAAYLNYLSTLASLLGLLHPGDAAARVLAIEERIARLHWDRVDNRNPALIFNPMTPAALARHAPGFDWAAFLESAGLGDVDHLSVSQPSAVAGIARLFADVPLSDWKLYFTLHALDASAAVLPEAFRHARFAFRGTALGGATSEVPRWQQAIGALNRALGEALGQIFVARHFPAGHKGRVQDMVDNLLAAYRDSINSLGWMAPQTRAQALEKLRKYRTKIGHPDKWRDYSALVVRGDDAFGNLRRAAEAEWQRLAAKAGQPVDHSEWAMNPQTVNAYYDASLNEIVFPAAILQPPLFDIDADDAANYGAIGAVIGHEISHGFDDQGSRFDGDGVLRNWWTDTDRLAFDAIGERLVTQFGAYEPLPGYPINGRLTLGENIADLSGLQIAFKAYQRSLRGQAAASTADARAATQRFFIGWAHAWRDKVREQRLLELLTTDPHSPAEFRANGAAVNHDAFHEAFGTAPGDRMFKAAVDRIRVW